MTSKPYRPTAIQLIDDQMGILHGMLGSTEALMDLAKAKASPELRAAHKSLLAAYRKEVRKFTRARDDLAPPSTPFFIVNSGSP